MQEIHRVQICLSASAVSGLSSPAQREQTVLGVTLTQASKCFQIFKGGSQENCLGFAATASLKLALVLKLVNFGKIAK